MNKHFDIEYKVIIIGESRIGKTSIIKRLNNQEFSENTVTTLGIDFVNVFYLIENLLVKLQIWDTAGQERFRTITRSHFRNTKGIVLAFDITDQGSFEKLEYWMDSIMNMQLSSEVIYLVGNKIDLITERKVSHELGKKFADRNMIKYFETSAKMNPKEIFEIFKSLATDILDLNNDIFKIKKRSMNDKNFVFSYNMPQEILFKQNDGTLKSKTTNSPFKKWITNKNNTNNLSNKDKLDLKNDNEIENATEKDKPFKIRAKKNIKISCCEVS